MGGLLEDKVVLITGGVSGIGEACADLAAEEGAHLILADLQEDLGAECITRLRGKGTQCHFIPTDVTIEQQVEASIALAVEKFGRLDGAINGAGINGDMASIVEMSREGWQRVIDINLTGVFLSLKYELQQMKRQGNGSIVNISSGGGVMAVPSMGAYCAAKHAILGLTKTAATETIKTDIRVNAVLPGSTETPMMASSLANEAVRDMILGSIPCGRMGQAREIAEGCIWLLSDRASYTNGTSLFVDGATVCR